MGCEAIKGVGMATASIDLDEVPWCTHDTVVTKPVKHPETDEVVQELVGVGKHVCEYGGTCGKKATHVVLFGGAKHPLCKEHALAKWHPKDLKGKIKAL